MMTREELAHLVESRSRFFTERRGRTARRVVVEMCTTTGAEALAVVGRHPAARVRPPNGGPVIGWRVSARGCHALALIDDVVDLLDSSTQARVSNVLDIVDRSHVAACLMHETHPYVAPRPSIVGVR